MSKQEHPDVISKILLKNFMKSCECNVIALENFFQRGEKGAAKQ